MKKTTLLPESKYLPSTTFKREERKLVTVQFHGINANCEYKKIV